MNKQCKTCKYLSYYLWMGEDEHRTVYSCLNHMPLNTIDCRMYKEDKDCD